MIANTVVWQLIPAKDGGLETSIIGDAKNRPSMNGPPSDVKEPSAAAGWHPVATRFAPALWGAMSCNQGIDQLR